MKKHLGPRKWAIDTRTHQEAQRDRGRKSAEGRVAAARFVEQLVGIILKDLTAHYRDEPTSKRTVAAVQFKLEERFGIQNSDTQVKRALHNYKLRSAP